MAVAEFKLQRLRLETDRRVEEIDEMIDFYDEEIEKDRFMNRNGQVSRDRIIREGLKLLKQDIP